MQCRAAPWGHLCRLEVNNLKRDEKKRKRYCSLVLVQEVQILLTLIYYCLIINKVFRTLHNIRVLGKKDNPRYLFQVWQYYLLPPEEQRMPGVKNPMCSAFPRVGEWSSFIREKSVLRWFTISNQLIVYFPSNDFCNIILSNQLLLLDQ